MFLAGWIGSLVQPSFFRRVQRKLQKVHQLEPRVPEHPHVIPGLAHQSPGKKNFEDAA